jgi:hypothetical protein
MADHLCHFFRELHPVLLVNAVTISGNDGSIEYIQKATKIHLAGQQT